MSNLVCLIPELYRAARAASIATIAAVIMVFPGMAAANPVFCVLVPHFKDEYWLSVGYGMEQEAAHQNVDLLIFEAGGYRARAEQITQLQDCAARGVDAILIGAVSSDHPDLIDAIRQVAQDIPVFALVNELHSDALAGRVGVDWYDMGLAIGQHLAQLHPAGSAAQVAVFVTGPSEAGWTAPLERGLRSGLANSSVTIAEVFSADTGLRQQLALVEAALGRHPDADYLIGCAPAIEAALGLRAQETNGGAPQLLSTYISHAVMRGVINGQVLAAAFDAPARQGIMSIKQAALLLRGGADDLPIGPKVMLLTPKDADLDQIVISPADYFPEIQ